MRGGAAEPHGTRVQGMGRATDRNYNLQIRPSLNVALPARKANRLLNMPPIITRQPALTSLRDSQSRAGCLGSRASREAL
jgi:hypothetical protein